MYEELLGEAEDSIWACSYAYFDGPRAFEVLARRMDEKPELRVTLLVNIQRRRGDTTAAEQLVRKFADRFWGAPQEAPSGVLVPVRAAHGVEEHPLAVDGAIERAVVSPNSVPRPPRHTRDGGHRGSVGS